MSGPDLDRLVAVDVHVEADDSGRYALDDELRAAASKYSEGAPPARTPQPGGRRSVSRALAVSRPGPSGTPRLQSAGTAEATGTAGGARTPRPSPGATR